MALAAIVALIAGQVVAQHAILGTPYLTGRTALFLLPLLACLVMTLADAVARAGLVPRVAATSLMLLLAALAVGHGVTVANTVRTLDWPGDAATPAMIEAVARAVGEGTPPDDVRLGVEWMFYPVARYYAARQPGPPRLTVEVVPGEGPPPEFVYAPQGSRLASGALVRVFAASRAALWRVGPEDGAR
jgi:hypothetical protein